MTDLNDRTALASLQASAASLAAFRAKAAAVIRADRLRAAGVALEKCGLRICIEPLYSPNEAIAADGLNAARYHVSRIIRRLSDGSDEPRYAAAMTARDALGKLWECL